MGVGGGRGSQRLLPKSRQDGGSLDQDQRGGDVGRGRIWDIF